MTLLGASPVRVAVTLKPSNEGRGPPNGSSLAKAGGALAADSSLRPAPH
jgi:hypothetical protein